MDKNFLPAPMSCHVMPTLPPSLWVGCNALPTAAPPPRRHFPNQHHHVSEGHMSGTPVK